MATVLAAAMLPNVANAQAVSAFNGNLGVGGGELQDHSGWLGIGRGVIPVGPDTGFQLDPFGGTANGLGYWGIGGNFFFRDPSKGSIGPIVSYQEYGSANLQHYGAQGEWYTGPVDLALRAGYQDGHQVNRGGFVELHAGFYLTPDLMIGTSSQYNAGHFDQTFDAEFLPHWQAVPGLSLFSNASVGSPGGTMVLAGIRFHFGPDKTLMERHHTDDVYFPFNDPLPRKTKPTPILLCRHPLRHPRLHHHHRRHRHRLRRRRYRNRPAASGPHRPQELRNV
jgi:hypothetical protein